MRRTGISLIETLIVVAILGVLIGLLVAAVHMVRTVALQTQNCNNLRQIALVTQTLFALGDGKLKNLVGSDMSKVRSLNGDMSLFFRLLPYVHRKPEYHDGMSTRKFMENFKPNAAAYRNPADPSYDYEKHSASSWGRCSYAMNLYAMDGGVDINSSLPDGTTNTILAADKYYSWCERDGGTSGYRVLLTYHD